jgi:hypothetical protein
MGAGGFLLTLTEEFANPERSLRLLADAVRRFEAGEARTD